jgi:hypothetical protein
MGVLGVSLKLALHRLRLRRSPIFDRSARRLRVEPQAGAAPAERSSTEA